MCRAPSGELSPRFTWTPLTTADALLGDTVTLECAAEAWPVPRVTWQRHGGLLPVNRHRNVLGQFITPKCCCRDENNKSSSGDEIANVNFLRRYGTYVLQNTKKENLLRLTN